MTTVFEEKEEALSCDQRIELLRKKIGWNKGEEFHFKRNSHNVRKAFLSTVAPYNFFYYGIIFSKDPKELSHKIFKSKKTFYSYACGLVFENAKNKLLNATVILDKSGGDEFRSELAKYLKSKMNQKGEIPIIKKVKMQVSRGNNLLQLADYIAGVINREVNNDRKFSKEYKKLISHREIEVAKWPK